MFIRASTWEVEDHIKVMSDYFGLGYHGMRCQIVTMQKDSVLINHVDSSISQLKSSPVIVHVSGNVVVITSNFTAPVHPVSDLLPTHWLACSGLMERDDGRPGS